jgi:hypothetical protein
VHAEELNDIDGLFYNVTTDGDANATLYEKITEMVITNSDQTPVATQGRSPTTIGKTIHRKRP